MVKVSVLMPIYNTQKSHLKSAIESVLSQTYSNFEFIILNDGSSSGHIKDTVNFYNDSRIVYHENEKNEGISKARNKLIDIAQGQYLAVMDSDDIILPGRLATQVECLDNNPDVVICGTAFKRFGKIFKNNTIIYPQFDRKIKATLFFKCVMHHPSAMIRKDTLIKNNIRYHDDFVSIHDRKMYFDISGFGKLHNINKVLCLYRLHDKMLSRRERQRIVSEQKKLRAYWLSMMSANLSQHESETLDNFVVKGRCKIRNISTLNNINYVLTKLVAANNKTHYFPVQEFEEICGSYLIKRCKNAAVYGFVSSKILLTRTTLPIKGSNNAILKFINWIRPVNQDATLINYTN